MASQMEWPHQAMLGQMTERFEKDDSWLMSTSLHKSQADMGSAEIYLRPSTTATGMRPSTSAASLGSAASHPSLPSLRIKSRSRNPVTDCLPDEVSAQAE